MGYQLWMSPVTDYRRNGTRFSSLKKIFMDSVTVKDVYEPLLCCKENDEAIHVKDTLLQREFDTAGVLNEEGSLIGYVETESLADNKVSHYIKTITIDQLISDSTPLANLLEIFKSRDLAYVNHGSKVIGVVTKADINKPPVRVYLFGMLSLFEMHVNSWIKYFHPDNSWKRHINAARIETATIIYEERKGNNQDLTLLDCIQLGDKRDILSRTPDFLDKFTFKKRPFEKFVKKVTKIRNDLAHSQDSVILNLEWVDFVNVLESVELFLLSSDHSIEEMARDGAQGFVEYLTPSA